MLNIVAGNENIPHAILVRGAGLYKGPGVLTKATGIDRSFYGEDLTSSERIWIEDEGLRPVYQTSPRIGIDYSGDYWKSRPWRYFI
jgi:DNA-3-methyladenine glycosylase